MNIFEILAEAHQQSAYNVLRTKPDSKGDIMTHSDIVTSLGLSDGKGAYYQAAYEVDGNE